MTVSKVRQSLGALTRVFRKWAPLRVFQQVYKGKLEPIFLYGSEVCYPTQVGLEQSLQSLSRVHRYAARLSSNDFTSEYPVVLEKLGWKSYQQLAVERWLTLM